MKSVEENICETIEFYVDKGLSSLDKLELTTGKIIDIIIDNAGNRKYKVKSRDIIIIANNINNSISYNKNDIVYLLGSIKSFYVILGIAQ